MLLLLLLLLLLQLLQQLQLLLQLLKNAIENRAGDAAERNGTMTTLPVTLKWLGSVQVLKQFEFNFDEPKAPWRLQHKAAEALGCKAQPRAARVVYVDPDLSLNLELSFPLQHTRHGTKQWAGWQKAWSTFLSVLAAKKAATASSELVQLPSITLLVTRFSQEMLWIDEINTSTSPWAAFFDMPTEARANRRVVLAALKIHSCVLAHACRTLQTDRSFLLAACRLNGYSLQYASDAFKMDRDVVFAAVRCYGCALKHASSDLQADREVVLAAVQNDHEALLFACVELQNDTELKAAASNR